MLSLVASLAIGTSAFASPPAVYHSVADDGVDPGAPVEIPPVQTTIHLYLDGGAVASAADACKAGDGDEVCGWRLHLEGQSGLDLVSFTPTGDVVFGLVGNTLRATGGDPAVGTLGPSRIGDLVVDGAEGGTLALLASESVGAGQVLEAIPTETLVFMPEPGAGVLLVFGCTWLGALARRRG